MRMTAIGVEKHSFQQREIARTIFMCLMYQASPGFYITV
jgi:hypothetical protein